LLTFPTLLPFNNFPNYFPAWTLLLLIIFIILMCLAVTPPFLITLVEHNSTLFFEIFLPVITFVNFYLVVLCSSVELSSYSSKEIFLPLLPSALSVLFPSLISVYSLCPPRGLLFLPFFCPMAPINFIL